MPFLGLLFFVFSLNLFAQGGTDQKILEIRTGDVILISLNCSICPLIENETNSPFSHSALVLKKDDASIYVAQALGPKVHFIPLAKFLNMVRPGGEAKLYRSRELNAMYLRAPKSFVHFEEEIVQNFNDFFVGLPFDPGFLWDNFDEQGAEKLYCSEFVAKLLNMSLRAPIKPLPMSFKRNWAAWERIFRSAIPEGKLGLSPADFTRNNKLFFVENL